MANSPSARTLAFYALPALPLAALGQPYYMFVPTFYAREVGISAAVLAAILLAVRLADAGFDLAAGPLSDRTSGRQGRRRPWILAGAPVIGLAAFLILNPPEAFAAPWIGAAWLGLCALALSAGLAMVVTPHNAWGAELSDTYAGRAVVAGWRETATLAGMIAATAWVGLAAASGSMREALSGLGFWVALALPAACVAAAVFVPDPPAARRPAGGRAPAGQSLSVALRACAGNRPFRVLVAAFLVNGIANALPATLFLYFVSDRLQRPDLAGLLLMAYLASGLLAAPAFAWAGARFGKSRVWIGSMLLAMGVFALALMVDGPEDVALFAAVCCVSGLALGADVTLPAAMQADVIEHDAVARGDIVPASGLYFALWSFATKLALAVAAALAFGGLALAGFDTGGAAAGVGVAGHAPGALWALSLLYCGVPIAFKACAVALAARYDLGQEAQARNRAVLDALKPAGAPADRDVSPSEPGRAG